MHKFIIQLYIIASVCIIAMYITATDEIRIIFFFLQNEVNKKRNKYILLVYITLVYITYFPYTAL